MMSSSLSSDDLNQILEKLGWQDGFQIPIANAENRGLEEELARLAERRLTLHQQLNDSNQRLKHMQTHYKHLEHEIEQNQKLLTTYAQHVLEEESNIYSEKCQLANLEADIRQTKKEQNDVEARAHNARKQLERNTAKLAQLQASTQWDNEALRAWEETLNVREQDQDLLERFSREDVRKIKELQVKLQNLEVEAADRKRTLDEELAVLAGSERTLERTGKLIREHAQERDALIQQWRQAVKTLEQRDEQIDQQQHLIIDVNQQIRVQQTVLEEQQTFHHTQTKQNSQIEGEIADLNSINSRLREEMSTCIESIAALTNEIQTGKRRLANTAHELDVARTTTDYLNRDWENQDQRISDANQQLEQLNEKLVEIKKSNLTANQRVKMMEKMLAQEMQRQKCISNDVDLMQFTLLKTQSELEKQKNTGKILSNKLDGLHINISQMKRHNKNVQNHLDQAKENVYDLGYKIDQMKQKIFKAETVHTDNHDDQALSTQIAKLEKRHQELLDLKALLQEQATNMQNDMKRLINVLATNTKQIEHLSSKLQNEKLEYDGGLRDLERGRAELQNAHVEENLLRLRLEHLSKAARKEDKSISDLQKYRLSLEQAMQERMQEIGASKDVLLVKKRHLALDRSRLNGELNERQLVVDQLRNKYGLLVDSFGRTDDGEPFSVVQFKITIAQEKFDLKQEGDELDCKIQKAEQEILALENTLKVLQTTNTKFKNSLDTLQENNEKVEELKQLEEQLVIEQTKYRELRHEYEEKVTIVKEEEQKLKELELKQQFVDEEIQKLEDEIEMHERMKRDKEEKLSRAEQHLKKLQRTLTVDKVECYERDLEIRLLQEANKTVLQRLVSLAREHDELMPRLRQLTDDAYIVLPKGGQLSQVTSSNDSRVTSVPSSSASSTSHTSTSKPTSTSSTSTAVSKVTLTLNL